MWNALPGRGWPLLQGEEELFLQHLHEACPSGPTKSIERSDITTLVTILRDGLTLVDARSFLPGLDPRRLLGAYEYLEHLRKQSVDAWESLVIDPSAVNLATVAHTAALLLPVPTNRVVSTAIEGFPESAHQVVAECQSLVAQTQRKGKLLEQRLGQGCTTVELCQEIGSRLYSPISSSVWIDPYYLPTRVGDLSPNRVRLLVGERH